MTTKLTPGTRTAAGTIDTVTSLLKDVEEAARAKGNEEAAETIEIIGAALDTARDEVEAANHYTPGEGWAVAREALIRVLT